MFFKKKSQVSLRLEKELGLYSKSFQEFYQHFVIQPMGLIRKEVDTSFLVAIEGEEREIMLAFLRSTLTDEKKKVYVVETLGELRDMSSVQKLSDLLDKQTKFGWKILISQALNRINGDQRYFEVISELFSGTDEKMKDFYQHHVIQSRNRDGIKYLIEKLSLQQNNERQYILHLLNCLKTGDQFSSIIDELPYSADYFVNNINDDQLLDELSGKPI